MIRLFSVRVLPGETVSDAIARVTALLDLLRGGVA